MILKTEILVRWSRGQNHALASDEKSRKGTRARETLREFPWERVPVCSGRGGAREASASSASAVKDGVEGGWVAVGCLETARRLRLRLCLHPGV